jgi:hypothetical protein
VQTRSCADPAWPGIQDLRLRAWRAMQKPKTSFGRVCAGHKIEVESKDWGRTLEGSHTGHVRIGAGLYAP